MNYSKLFKNIFSQTLRPSSRWNKYIKRTKYEQEVNKSAVLAEKLFSQDFKGSDRPVVDLGCGTGKDTIFFLEKGHNVLAIDHNKRALKVVRKKAKSIKRKNCLKIIRSSFENMEYPPNVGLLCAHLSITFLNQERFLQTLEIIAQSLCPGGYFSAIVFGHKHEWKQKHREYYYCTKDSLTGAIRQCKLNLIRLEEILETKPEKISGNLIAWHVYEIIAKKDL